MYKKKKRMGKNNGKSAIRGGGGRGPTPNGKCHEKCPHFFKTVLNGLICVNIPMLGALSVNILQGPATPNFER